MSIIYTTPDNVPCASIDAGGYCEEYDKPCPGHALCPDVNACKCLHKSGTLCGLDLEKCAGVCTYYKKFPKEPEGVKFDDAKLRYDLLPYDALDEVVKRFTHGAKKYAPDNWKTVPDGAGRYKAALMRHFSKYCQGEQNDPDAAELSHIGAVAWNALALVWFELHGQKSRQEVK